MIRFQVPLWSLGFVLVLASAVVMALGRSLRRKNYDRLIQKDLQPFVTLHASSKERIILLCYLGALSFFILALMRPQWGSRWEQVQKQGYDVLFAIDVSKSMLAQDIKPSRLERTKLAVGDFIHQKAADRVGIIAFAGDAFLVCPLTTDHEIIQTILNDLSFQSISSQGTAMASAIQEAVKAYKEGGNSPQKILFLISDGEDHEGRVTEAALEARKAGIRIYALGIGSPEGELITITHPRGSSDYLKDKQGRVVKSRLNEAVLKKTAEATNGAYRRSSSVDFGLESLYDKATEGYKKQDFSETGMQRYTQRFQIFLVAAIFLLFAEIFLKQEKSIL